MNQTQWLSGQYIAGDDEEHGDCIVASRKEDPNTGETDKVILVVPAESILEDEFTLDVRMAPDLVM